MYIATFTMWWRFQAGPASHLVTSSLNSIFHVLEKAKKLESKILSDKLDFQKKFLLESKILSEKVTFRGNFNFLIF